MVIDYTPKGVCSRKITVEIDDDGIIQDVKFFGGCHGNAQGISALIKGMKADEAIKRLDNIRCGSRYTSCPDQLAKALKSALDREASQ
jgi:uncharacterized protein (TIGR03905 family)